MNEIFSGRSVKSSLPHIKVLWDYLRGLCDSLHLSLIESCNLWLEEISSIIRQKCESQNRVWDWRFGAIVYEQRCTVLFISIKRIFLRLNIIFLNSGDGVHYKLFTPTIEHGDGFNKYSKWHLFFFNILLQD